MIPWYGSAPTRERERERRRQRIYTQTKTKTETEAETETETTTEADAEAKAEKETEPEPKKGHKTQLYNFWFLFSVCHFLNTPPPPRTPLPTRAKAITDKRG